jgi:hypothetical protein
MGQVFTVTYLEGTILHTCLLPGLATFVRLDAGGSLLGQDPSQITSQR